jgi:hypothetical protein
LCHFFTAVPSIPWRGSTVTSSHSECSAGNWLPRNNFCIVHYRSECIYILQINFIKKKDTEVIKELLRLSNELAMCLNGQIFCQSLYVFTAFQNKSMPWRSAARVDTKLKCNVNTYHYFYFQTWTSNYLFRRSMILNYVFLQIHFRCPNKHILSLLRRPKV